jgi:hypothetical protein
MGHRSVGDMSPSSQHPFIIPPKGGATTAPGNSTWSYSGLDQVLYQECERRQRVPVRNDTSTQSSGMDPPPQLAFTNHAPCRRRGSASVVLELHSQVKYRDRRGQRYLTDSARRRASAAWLIAGRQRISLAGYARSTRSGESSAWTNFFARCCELKRSGHPRDGASC